MRGDLPFDPFMIKQRMPFFLYSLEELRCDLTAFRECVGIAARLSARADQGEELTDAEQEMLDHAQLVQYAVIFDRIFRFAITGTRAQLRRTRRPAAVRLAAPARRAALDRHRTGVRLGRRAGGGHRAQRRDRPAVLGVDRPAEVAHWLAAYELVRVVTPHPASCGRAACPDEVLAGPPKGYTDAVLDDEFPLSMFFEALDKKMHGVISRPRASRAAMGDGVRGRTIVVAGATSASGRAAARALVAARGERHRGGAPR
jgi:hypothetical protein